MAKSFFTKRDVYLEIAERYEKYITLGVIKTGERLPSVRVAAGELGVNPNTFIFCFIIFILLFSY